MSGTSINIPCTENGLRKKKIQQGNKNSGQLKVATLSRGRRFCEAKAKWKKWKVGERN